MTYNTKLLLSVFGLFGLALVACGQTNLLAADTFPSSLTPSPFTDAMSLILGLMGAGAILKHAVPQFPNRFIPLTTMLMGTVGYMLMTDADWSNGKAWFMSFLISASATGTHSGIKHTLVNTPER
jgi:hypothetical protein